MTRPPEDGILSSGIAQELLQGVTGNVFVNGFGGFQDIERMRLLPILHRHPRRIRELTACESGYRSFPRIAGSGPRWGYTEQFLRFVLHGEEIQSRMSVGTKSDQQIGIAGRARFVSGDGAKYFKTSNAMRAAEVRYERPDFVDCGDGCNRHMATKY